MLALATAYDPGRITWAILLMGAAAAAAALWASVLRLQVQARTRALRLSLEAQHKAGQFETARNEVLENTARNHPLAQNMDRLARAIEEQIPDSACLVVMSPDGKSFHNGRPAPVLIAPSIPEELHPVLSPALTAVMNPAGENSEPTGGMRDEEVMTTLVEILQRGGLPFKTGRMTVAFSGAGEAAGVILLFLQNEPQDSDAVMHGVMNSASRLVALAVDHWRMHARLLHEARHDALTGLPNRTVAEDRLDQTLARAERSRKMFAVFCVDLDGFKAINDELGHDAGDEILRMVSLRLRSNLRHSDTLARIGGDEFLGLIEDCAGRAAAQSVAQSLVSALQDALPLNGCQLRLSGSIGIAMYPGDGKNAAQLRRHADLAMYRAKALGGGQVAFWSGEIAISGKAAQKSSSN